MSWQRGWGEAEIGSDARPVGRGEMVALSRGELRDLVARSRAKGARRALAGVGLALALVAAVAGAARAETISIGSSAFNGGAAQGTTVGTTVSIAPSGRPGEWAVVTLQNRAVNGSADSGLYALTFDGVAIGVAFTWDADPVLGSDRITITPPEGVTCLPEDCTATVIEGFSGHVILIDWRGV